MPRFDPDGTRHPVGADVPQAGDAAHINACADCRDTSWGALYWLASMPDVND